MRMKMNIKQTPCTKVSRLWVKMKSKGSNLKNLFVILLLFVFLLVSCNSSSSVSNESSTEMTSEKVVSKANFEINNTVVSLPEKHREIDLEIDGAAKDKSNTFEMPLIIQDPFDISPLTAVAVFYTNKNVAIRMTVVGDTKADTYTYNFPAAKAHRLPIIGLYAARENTVILEQLGVSTGKVKNEIKIITEPLPSLLSKNVEVTLAKGAAVNGITVISGLHSKTPYAFDTSGKIRWYIKVTSESYGYFPMSNERFMLMNVDGMVPTKVKPFSAEVYDMDFLGRVHNIYLVPKGAHHEIIEKTPNGNLLMLSNSINNHEEDSIVEIDRTTGKVVKFLSLSDVIKNTHDKPYDWAHINAISYNLKENTVILSCRNISSVVKLNWSSHKLLWILADPTIWKNTTYEKYVLKPVGPTIWHYEQHAAYDMLQDLDNNPKTMDLMLFDNRSFSIVPVKLNIKTELNTSSVVHYSIDEKAGTVKQLKRITNVHSDITSNFTLFSNQNRLVAYHGSVAGTSKQIGQIFEYEYSTGKLLRSYKTSDSFYRGYRQNFNYAAVNQPMEDNTNFIKGDLLPFIKNSKPVTSPEFIAPEEMKYWRSDDLLYITMRYSLVSKVEFVGEGKNGTWVINLVSDSTKKLKAGTFKKPVGNKLIQLPNFNNVTKYNFVVQLKQLPKGTYKLNIEYAGLYTSTGGVIKIE